MRRYSAALTMQCNCVWGGGGGGGGVFCTPDEVTMIDAVMKVYIYMIVQE